MQDKDAAISRQCDSEKIERQKLTLVVEESPLRPKPLVQLAIEVQLSARCPDRRKLRVVKVQFHNVDVRILGKKVLKSSNGTA